MTTEREVVYQIIHNRPEGFSGLFERHGALFREGLIRFFGSAGPEQANRLERMVRTVSEWLRSGAFDDLVETFYNWIVRASWCAFMKMKMEEEGGDHLDPAIIYTFVHRVDVDALAEGERSNAEAHLDACAFCSKLLEGSKAIPVEVRHAGAPYPEDFGPVIRKVLENLA